jgi:hypothetical protein
VSGSGATIELLRLAIVIRFPRLVLEDRARKKDVTRVKNGGNVLEERKNGLWVCLYHPMSDRPGLYILKRGKSSEN